MDRVLFLRGVTPEHRRQECNNRGNGKCSCAASLIHWEINAVEKVEESITSVKVPQETKGSVNYMYVVEQKLPERVRAS